MTETIKSSRLRAGRRFMSGVLGAGVVSALLLSGATGAQAAKGDFKGDPDFTGPTTSNVTDSQGGVENGTMYGAYLPTGGVLDGKKVWCADPGLDWPYADAYEDGSDTKIKAPKLAYVLNEFDVNQGSETKNMARDIALASYLKQSKEIRHRAILDVGSPQSVTNGIGWNENSKNVKKVGKDKFNKEVLPQAQTYYENMVKAEKDIPATPDNLGIDVDTKAETVTVTLSDDGKNVAGYDATVNLSGAEFENGKTSAKFETGAKAQTLKIDVKKAGTVKADVKVGNIAPTEVVRWTPKGYTDKKASSSSADLNPNQGSKDGYNRYSVQEVYEKLKPTSLNASTQDTTRNRPAVTTTINDQDLQPGDSVYDNFEVKGLVGEDTVDVEHTLWWSPVKPEQTKEPQDGHTEVASVTSKGVGNGQHKTEAVKIPEDVEGGYFYWTEKISESETTEAWESDYGIPGETGFIPYTPQGETNLSENKTQKLPVKIHDDGKITGGMPGQELPVTIQVYKDGDCTVEQSTEVPEDAELLSTTNLKVKLDENGNGTYQTEKLELLKDLVKEGDCGAVTAVETIAKTDYSEKAVSDYGIPSESMSIEIPAPETPEQPETPDTPEQPESPKAETPEKPQPKHPTVKTGGEETNVFKTFYSSVSDAIQNLL